MWDRLHPTDDEATTIRIPLIPEFDISMRAETGGGKRREEWMEENKNLRGRTRQIATRMSETAIVQRV